MAEFIFHLVTGAGFGGLCFCHNQYCTTVYNQIYKLYIFIDRLTQLGVYFYCAKRNDFRYQEILHQRWTWHSDNRLFQRMSAFVFVVPQPGEHLVHAATALSSRAAVCCVARAWRFVPKGRSLESKFNFDPKVGTLCGHRPGKMRPLPDLHFGLLRRGAAVFGA